MVIILIRILEWHDKPAARIEQLIKRTQHLYKKIIGEIIKISHAVNNVLHSEFHHIQLMIKHPKGIILAKLYLGKRLCIRETTLCKIQGIIVKVYAYNPGF